MDERLDAAEMCASNAARAVTRLAARVAEELEEMTDVGAPPQVEPPKVADEMRQVIAVARTRTSTARQTAQLASCYPSAIRRA